MNHPQSEVSKELRLERTFDAPRALVFENWVMAQHVGAWFAPEGFEVEDCFVDARPGGRLRVVYASPAGQRHVEHGEFIDVQAPERLHFTLVNEDGSGRVHFRTEVRVVFREDGTRTRLELVQTGLGAPEVGALELGWGTCFDRLSRQLAAEREVRALFEDWFRASERKDLEASMAPVASSVESYEHELPLVHRGVDALRAACKLGFDGVPDTFRWEVPDLKVMVRGDLAITWGLNHMAGAGLDSWSRGTRVFQRIGGRWRMDLRPS
jgi:uncharacterized protein YndB with AHSA1/START domain/ketosteroid isomerase-like protein